MAAAAARESLVVDVGGGINAISASPNDDFVAVAGRDVLKVFAVSRAGVREARNLRVGRKKGLDLSVSDVRWHPTHCNILATGSTNGAVLTWDISKQRSQSAQEQSFKHARTVNRVAWHPWAESWLLTCSQDATVRLWDARVRSGADGDSRAAVTCPIYVYSARSEHEMRAIRIGVEGMEYHPNADAVRDVAFDPFSPLTFAACTESGALQLWDVRMPQGPLAAFTAHTGLAMALHWHPLHPDILATAGRDRLVKVWRVGDRSPTFMADAAERLSLSEVPIDESDAAATPAAAVGDQQLRPLVVVQTIASVSRMCWRTVPTEALAGDIDEELEEEATATSASDTYSPRTASVRAVRRARKDVTQFQITTCSALDTNCCVWDIRNPYIPVAVFGGHKDIAAGMNWIREPSPTESGGHYGPWLLSGGKDGKLILHDPQDAKRPHASMCVISTAVSAAELAWCTQHVNRHVYWPGTMDLSRDAAKRAASTCVDVISSDPRLAIAARAGHQTPSSQRALDILARAVDATQPPAHIFAVLALMYVTEGAPANVLCAHNAEVADVMGLRTLAQVWRVLGELYGPPPRSGVPTVPAALSHKARVEAAKKRRAAVHVELTAAVAARARNERAGSGDTASVDGTQLSRLDVDGETVSLGPTAMEDGRAHEHDDSVMGESVTFVDTLRILVDRTDDRHARVPGYIPGLLEALSLLNPAASGPRGFDVDTASTVSETTLAAPVEEPLLGSARRGRMQSTFTGNDAESDGDSTAVSSEDAAALAHESGPATALSVIELGVDPEDWSAFRIEVALDVLRYYADIGDVQTCVTIARVLGGSVEKRVGKRMLQQWLVNYIDLLHRFKLWSPASTVMARCSDENIRRMNQQHTALQPACAACTRDISAKPPPGDLLVFDPLNEAMYAVDAHGSKRLSLDDNPAPIAAPGAAAFLPVSKVGELQLMAPAVCEAATCHKPTSTCSICLQPVRGLFTWCQGCGHGGHLSHMVEWFTQFGSLCPAGCMHVCTLDASHTLMVS